MSVAFQNSLLPTYPPSRVTFVDGLGACLSDADGREYLDFAAGHAETLVDGGVFDGGIVPKLLAAAIAARNGIAADIGATAVVA